MESNYPYSDRLIVGVDESFKKTATSSDTITRARRLLTETCEELKEFEVQIKLNTLIRVLGFEAYEIVAASGLTVFADHKFSDIVDTILSDVRALRHYPCIKRITFRSEMHTDFPQEALELMPGTSFIPVGVLTDNDDTYFKEYGIASRADALRQFCNRVQHFSEIIEVVMSPQDLKHLTSEFKTRYNILTPAVRPEGLSGNARNNANATTVEEAFRAGATAIIVGSPIMTAGNRKKATELVLDQIKSSFESTNE